MSFQGLQEVIVAHVAFNALSGQEPAWLKDLLGKSDRMFKDRRRSVKVVRGKPWWTISGKKGKILQGVKMDCFTTDGVAYYLDVIQDLRMQECRRRSPKF